MRDLNQQPVSVVIAADQSVSQNYKSGTVTSGCGANKEVNLKEKKSGEMDCQILLVPPRGEGAGKVHPSKLPI